ncbi:MAG: redoxin domain-containing protein [Haloferacaceae archaeon]
MLQPGQRAPSFELPGTGGDGVSTHALDSYLDRGWTVVLVFYPFDFHPACVSRLCALRDADWLTLEDDVAVLGIGTDSAHSHQVFARREDVGFPLLSDSDGRVSEAYGVLHDEFEGHRDVAASALFVVDTGGEVTYAWRGDGPGDALDLHAVRTAVRETGEDAARDAPDDSAA